MARIIDLQQTKGEFKLRGLVTGVKKSYFFDKTETGKGVPAHKMKFGIKTDKNSEVNVDTYVMQQANVFFYKKSDVKGQKGDTQKVPYSQYKSFNKEGYNVIGMTNGIDQVQDDKGKSKNQLVTLPDYDAIEWLSTKLEDDMGVFVFGELDFNSFKNKNGEVTRSTKLKPTKVLRSVGFDLDAEDFEKTSNFKQTVVFTGITKDDSDPQDIKFIVEGLVVNYSTIEQVEFVLRNAKLAQTMKKKLKPYTAFEIYGNVNAVVELAEEEEEDEWGAPNPFAQKKLDKYHLELEMTGLDGGSIDEDTYSEKEIEKALKAIADSKKAKEDFGSTDDVEDWGTTTNLSSNDDDDLSWD